MKNNLDNFNTIDFNFKLNINLKNHILNTKPPLLNVKPFDSITRNIRINFDMPLETIFNNKMTNILYGKNIFEM